MAERLKDLFFSDKFISELSQAITKVYSGFEGKKFQQTLFSDDWAEKELKEKMHQITHSLASFLPEDYSAALEILKNAAPEFKGFDAMIFPDFVEQYGQDFWDLSLPALGTFTSLCSSEFAVRPFIIKDQMRALETMKGWAKSDNLHLRRLASEGCRPRLPWAMALSNLKTDPTPILPILEILKEDPEVYVQKSVANNLNDISKDHPELVLDICEKWYGQNRQTDWIVKRACRSLLKQGNTRAMVLFGFEDPREIQIKNFIFDRNTLNIGEVLNFSFEMDVLSKIPRKIRLEYAVEFVKVRGKVSRKIFQIKEAEWSKGTFAIQKKHSFKDLSTRKHLSGTHRIFIIVNGVEKASGAVELK